MLARPDSRPRPFAVIVVQCSGILIREFLINPPQRGIDVRFREPAALPFPFREIMRVIFHGLTLPTGATPVILDDATRSGTEINPDQDPPAIRRMSAAFAPPRQAFNRH